MLGVALWELLAFYAAAQSCEYDQYQSAPLVLDCAGASGSKTVDLEQGVTDVIVQLPVGASDVIITMTADSDLDMKLVNMNTDTCAFGYGCDPGGSAGTQTYEGTSIYFSGDDTSAPVEETLQIYGSTQIPFEMRVHAFATASGTITYSYGTINPCPAVKPGCSLCAAYSCGVGQVAMCDGSTTVSCQVPNVCTCNQGSEAIGTYCTTDGAEICDTCNTGYVLNGLICEATTTISATATSTASATATSTATTTASMTATSSTTASMTATSSTTASTTVTSSTTTSSSRTATITSTTSVTGTHSSTTSSTSSATTTSSTKTSTTTTSMSTSTLTATSSTTSESTTTSSTATSTASSISTTSSTTVSSTETSTSTSTSITTTSSFSSTTTTLDLLGDVGVDLPNQILSFVGTQDLQNLTNQKYSVLDTPLGTTRLVRLELEVQVGQSQYQEISTRGDGGVADILLPAGSIILNETEETAWLTVTEVCDLSNASNCSQADVGESNLTDTTMSEPSSVVHVALLVRRKWRKWRRRDRSSGRQLSEEEEETWRMETLESPRAKEPIFVQVSDFTPTRSTRCAIWQLRRDGWSFEGVSAATSQDLKDQALDSQPGFWCSAESLGSGILGMFEMEETPQPIGAGAGDTQANAVIIALFTVFFLTCGGCLLALVKYRRSQAAALAAASEKDLENDKAEASTAEAAQAVPDEKPTVDIELRESEAEATQAVPVEFSTVDIELRESTSLSLEIQGSPPSQPGKELLIAASHESPLPSPRDIASPQHPDAQKRVVFEL